MRVQVRYRRDGLFVEPSRQDLACLAFRYISHLAGTQFGPEAVTPENRDKARGGIRGKNSAKSPT